MTLDKTLRVTVSTVALIGAGFLALPAQAGPNVINVVPPAAYQTGPLQGKVPATSGNAVTVAPNIDAARVTGAAQTDDRRRQAQSRNLPGSSAGGVNARLGTESLGNGETAVVDLEGDRLVQVAIEPSSGGDAAMKALAEAAKAAGDGGQATRITQEMAKRVIDKAVNLSGVTPASGVKQLANGEIVLTGDGAAAPALDPEERDRAFGARRSLSDHAGLAGRTGADHRQLERIGEAGEVAREVQLLEQARAAADLDAIKETVPESNDPIAGRGAGPEAPALNPGEPRVQPGGPNDPANRDGLPDLFGYDPQNPGATRRDEGPRNPSNTIPDPRGPASQQGGNGSNGPRVVSHSEENRGGTVYSWTRFSDGSRRVSKTTQSETGFATVTNQLDFNPDGTKTYSTTTEYGDSSGIRHIWNPDGSEDIYQKDSEGRTWHTHIEPDGTETTVRTDDDGDDPAGQPAPHDGETGDFDISLCVQAKLCGHQSFHSASPDEMLTQPGGGGQDTGSIMGSGASGPDLGREAVTNTGDGSFDTTGGGGGGGSGGVDYQKPGDPVEPIE